MLLNAVEMCLEILLWKSIVVSIQVKRLRVEFAHLGDLAWGELNSVMSLPSNLSFPLGTVLPIVGRGEVT